MGIQGKIKDIFGWKDKRPDTKKKLDSLKIGDTYFDPYTQTRYECIAKLPNGESITIARSLGVEVI